MQFQVRAFEPEDEIGWVRCRALSFLDSAYFDNVITSKERYDNPSIELIAALDGSVVGLIDVEYELEPCTVAYECNEDPRSDRGAVIHHLAVHPDYRRMGIATRLLELALERLQEEGVGFIEAWTRDDEHACRWYETRGFRQVHSYLHVYIDGSNESQGALKSEIPRLVPCYTFAHYVGTDKDAIRQRFKRVHECQLFRRSV